MISSRPKSRITSLIVERVVAGLSPRGAIAGGNWNNGSNAGRFALNLNNAPTNTNNNIGFRCALPEV